MIVYHPTYCTSHDLNDFRIIVWLKITQVCIKPESDLVKTLSVTFHFSFWVKHKAHEILKNFKAIRRPTCSQGLAFFQSASVIFYFIETQCVKLA